MFELLKASYQTLEPSYCSLHQLYPLLSTQNCVTFRFIVFRCSVFCTFIVNTENIGSLKITRMTHLEHERQEGRTDLQGMRSKGCWVLTGHRCNDVKVMTDKYRIVSSSVVVLEITRFISECNLLENGIWLCKCRLYFQYVTVLRHWTLLPATKDVVCVVSRSKTKW